MKIVPKNLVVGCRREERKKSPQKLSIFFFKLAKYHDKLTTFGENFGDLWYIIDFFLIVLAVAHIVPCLIFHRFISLQLIFPKFSWFFLQPSVADFVSVIPDIEYLSYSSMLFPIVQTLVGNSFLLCNLENMFNKIFDKKVFLKSRWF